MKPSQYAVFRSHALSAQREQLGIGVPQKEFPVWGALMEVAIPVGFFTVLALNDGTASVYFSNGAAVIGGGRTRACAAPRWALLNVRTKLGRNCGQH